MAYCKNCGAYIPDELSACLACGFDEQEAKAAAAAAAAAQEKKAEKAEQEDLHEILERHRKLQQEKNRQWAEKEKERREREQENRRWAQEEYARRQAEKEAEAEKRSREEKETRQHEEAAFDADKQTAAKSESVVLSVLSYLSFFFIIPLLVAPQDRFTRFHAMQGLRLFIFGAIADVIGGLTGIGWVISLFRIYCIYKGITNALQGKKEPLPLIGTIGNR